MFRPLFDLWLTSDHATDWRTERQERTRERREKERANKREVRGGESEQERGESKQLEGGTILYIGRHLGSNS